MTPRLTFMLLAGALIAADPKDETKSIQGTWVVTRAEREGEELSNPVGDKVVIDADQIRITTTTGGEHKARYTLNRDAPTKMIDLVPDPTENPRGQTWLGIYAVDGDELKLCLGEPGKPRPMEFDTQPRDGSALYVMKRHAE